MSNLTRWNPINEFEDLMNRYNRMFGLTRAGEREGKAKVAEFFELVAEFERFEQFEPREFVAQGDKVVAIGHYRAVTKPTGRRFESDFVMVFTLRGGKVARFQEFTDSAGINAAFA